VVDVMAVENSEWMVGVVVTEDSNGDVTLHPQRASRKTVIRHGNNSFFIKNISLN